jgi:hypothetical protein
LIKYQLDENIHGAVAPGLRRRGVEVHTAAELALIGTSDDEQLARATADGRVLVTHDDDFLALHASGMQHAGIAFCHPKRARIGHLVLSLTRLWRTRTAEEMQGSVEFL